MKLSLFKRSAGKSDKRAGTTVDAMMVACVHEPEIPVTPASGEPLRQLASKSLANWNRKLVLKEDAYVRFMLVGDSPGMGPMAGGIPPGMVPPGVNPRHMAFLMGAKSMSDHEKEAGKLLPTEMASALRDQGMDPADYDLRSFSETPDPGVKFLWMAAIHK